MRPAITFFYIQLSNSRVGAKGDDKEYRLVLPRNLDVNEQGMVEKVEKLKGRQHLNSNK